GAGTTPAGRRVRGAGARLSWGKPPGPVGPVCGLPSGFASGPPPAVAAEAMAATSQPLATRAALRALERGGNAADAAIAAAAMLCVTEPMSTGIRGAAFAIGWRHGGGEGLDAAAPAAGPARAALPRPCPAAHGDDPHP